MDSVINRNVLQIRFIFLDLQCVNSKLILRDINSLDQIVLTTHIYDLRIVDVSHELIIYKNSNGGYGINVL